MSVTRTASVTKDNWIIQRAGSTTKYGNGSTAKITIGPAASATDATIFYKGRGLYSVSPADMFDLLTGLGSLSAATFNAKVASAECGSRGAAQRIWLEEVTGDFTTNTTASNCQISTAGPASSVWPGPSVQTTNRGLLVTSGLATGDTVSISILALLRARVAAGNLGVLRFRLIAANAGTGYDELNTARTVALYSTKSVGNEPWLSVTGELASAAVSASAGTARGTGIARAPAASGASGGGTGLSKLYVDGEFGIISLRQQNNPKVATLNGLSVTDALIMVTFTLDKIPIGDYAMVRPICRYINISNYYRLNTRVTLSGTVDLRISKVVAGVVTSLAFAESGLTLLIGETYFVNFQCTGTSPTTLSGKVWRKGTAAPDWQVTATDTAAAMQVAGKVGIGGQAGVVTNLPINFSIDEFSVVAP